MRKRKIICPVCKKQFVVIGGFVRCSCGIIPYGIISNLNSFISAQLRNIKADEFDPCKQQRAWAYMDLACDLILHKREFRDLKYLPENLRKKLVGLGNLESLKESLEKDVKPVGENLIIPNIVLDSYISGFWILQNGAIYYHKLFDGGLAFGFTLRDPETDYSEVIFVYQNILAALKTIIQYYKDSSKLPLVVAHPQFDLIPNLFWLPQKIPILITKNATAGELTKLLPLKPLIVEEKITKHSEARMRLKYFKLQAKPLEKEIIPFVALSPKTYLAVLNNKWFAYPSQKLLLNADIQLKKCFKFGNKKGYEFLIKINNEELHLHSGSTKNLFRKIQKLCEDAGEILIAGSRKIKKELPKLVLSRSPNIKIKKVRFGLVKKTFIFPGLYIHSGKIYKYKTVFHRNFPGAFLSAQKYEPIKFSSEGEINQGILFLLWAYSTWNLHSRHKILINLICRPSDIIEYIFRNLGVPINPNKDIRGLCWPMLYFGNIPSKSLTTASFLVHNKKIDQIEDTKVLNIYLNNVFLPLLPEEKYSGFCLKWLQFISTRDGKGNFKINFLNLFPEFAIMLDIFKEKLITL